MKNINKHLFWPPEILAQIFDYALTDLTQLQALLEVRNTEFHQQFFYYIQFCEKKRLSHLFKACFSSGIHAREILSTLESFRSHSLEYEATYIYLHILLFYFSPPEWLKKQIRNKDSHIYQFSECLQKKSLASLAFPKKFQATLERSLFFKAVCWKYQTMMSLEKTSIPSDYEITHLSECDLSHINLENSFLKNIYMYGTCLRNTNLSSAIFMWVNMKNSDLQGANLEFADLWGTRLQEVNLQYSNLSYANLQSGCLKYSNFYGAILYNTKLEKADLSGANLKNTDLRWTYLKDARFEGTHLAGTQFNENFQKSVTLKQLSQMVICKDNLRDKIFSAFFEKALNYKIQELQKDNIYIKAKRLDIWQEGTTANVSNPWVYREYQDYEPNSETTQHSTVKNIKQNLCTLIKLYIIYRSSLQTYTGYLSKNTIYSFFQPYISYSKEEKISAAQWLLDKLKTESEFEQVPKALQQGMLGKIFLAAQSYMKTQTEHALRCL